MQQIVAPFLRRFAPELLLVSAGFDGHWSDPLTSLGLSTAGFSLLSSRLIALADEICSGKIVFVLEGGYDPTNVANGSLAILGALTGTPFADPRDGFPGTEPDVEAHIDLIRSLHGL
jgi:acetoin utilization deacetylase AcuC-like enzyme